MCFSFLMMQKSKKISIIDIYYRHYYHCYCILYIFLYCQYHYYIDWKIIIALSWSQRAIYSYKCWRKLTPSRFNNSVSIPLVSGPAQSHSGALELLPPTVAGDDLARLPSASAELRRRAHRGDENKHVLRLMPKCLTQASKQTNKHCVL